MLRFLFARRDTAPWFTPANARCFSIHRKSGIRSVLFALALVSVVELVGLHYLLSLWNHWIAWAASLSTLWLLLSIAAQFRAVKFCPVYLLEQTLMIRNGMFELAEVPVAQIESATLSRKLAADPGAKAQTLVGCVPASHNMVIELKQPVTAKLLYGKTRNVSRILLAIDEPERLIHALESAASAAATANGNE